MGVCLSYFLKRNASDTRGQLRSCFPNIWYHQSTKLEGGGLQASIQPSKPCGGRPILDPDSLCILMCDSCHSSRRPRGCLAEGYRAAQDPKGVCHCLRHGKQPTRQRAGPAASPVPTSGKSKTVFLKERMEALQFKTPF